jgi:hypothetical protein
VASGRLGRVALEADLERNPAIMNEWSHLARNRWFNPFRRTVLAAVLGLLLPAGCSRAPQLLLHNRASRTVSRLVVSGTGFTRALGDLAPGETLRQTLEPTGDSSLRFAFDVYGRRVEVGPIGYVEAAAGHRIEAEITPSLEVRLVGIESGSAESGKGVR